SRYGPQAVRPLDPVDAEEWRVPESYAHAELDLNHAQKAGVVQAVGGTSRRPGVSLHPSCTAGGLAAHRERQRQSEEPGRRAAHEGRAAESRGVYPDVCAGWRKDYQRAGFGAK